MPDQRFSPNPDQRPDDLPCLNPVAHVDLRAIGWRDLPVPAGAVPARVSRIDRNRATVLTAGGERRLPVAGRLFGPTGESLAVGDWVAVTTERIVAQLPRHGVLARQRAGGQSTAQVLAVGVDVVFVVAALGEPVREGWIQRFVAFAWSSGATPVVVLNKADRVADPAGPVSQVACEVPGADVVATSATDGAGIEALAARLSAGCTGVLIGASGVGKSSVAERLSGADVAVSAVRAVDDRGRHTTTWRELVVLPDGGALIDTPGLRGLSLWLGGDATSAAYDDIDELAAACRFTDCGHDTEPGCAVGAAIADGSLRRERYAAYRKLQREQAWLERRTDARARSIVTAKYKERARSARETRRRGMQ